MLANSLFFSYLILKELQENFSDSAKIMEKFSQPADKNRYALLPGAAQRDYKHLATVTYIDSN